MKDAISIMAFSLIVGVFTMIGIYSIKRKKDQECDEVVFIEGELGIDARQVSSFSNGMSVIRLCDGTDLQVATHRIIKIVDK
jgi:hypothetical protein